MKRFKASLLTLSVLLYSASAFAQHGHAGGSMGAGNHAMSHAARSAHPSTCRPACLQTASSLRRSRHSQE
jgi:hypothetical protein